MERPIFMTRVAPNMDLGPAMGGARVGPGGRVHGVHESQLPPVVGKR